MKSLNRRTLSGSILMAIAGFGFVVYAIVLFASDFGPRFFEQGVMSSMVTADKSAIMAYNATIYNFINHLQIGFAAFMASTGLSVIGLSIYGVRRGRLWAWVWSVISTVTALVVTLPSYYAFGLDSIWNVGGLYLIGLVWIVGALVSISGLTYQERELEAPRPAHEAA